jgi:hypothetical protein
VRQPTVRPPFRIARVSNTSLSTLKTQVIGADRGAQTVACVPKLSSTSTKAQLQRPDAPLPPPPALCQHPGQTSANSGNRGPGGGSTVFRRVPSGKGSVASRLRYPARCHGWAGRAQPWAKQICTSPR